MNILKMRFDIEAPDSSATRYSGLDISRILTSAADRVKPSDPVASTAAKRRHTRTGKHRTARTVRGAAIYRTIESAQRPRLVVASLLRSSRRPLQLKICYIGP